MSPTTELRIAEARTLPHIQRLRSGYHYFRRGHVKGPLPKPEGSPQYFAEHERLSAIAENRATEPPRPARPVRVPLPAASFGWVCQQFLAHDDFRKRRRASTQAAYRPMIQHLLDSDIARAPLAGLNRQHVQHLCNEVEKKHGRSRGDFAAMIISILWTFADERLSKQCKIDGRTNPVHRRGRTYRAAPRLAWPVAVQRRFIEGNPLAPTPQGRAPAPPHLALAFALLLETGQRRSDVVRMRWSHIEHDADGQWLMVHAQQKTGEAVPIPLHKDLRVALGEEPRAARRKRHRILFLRVLRHRQDVGNLASDRAWHLARCVHLQSRQSQRCFLRPFVRAFCHPARHHARYGANPRVS
jgi:integrase